MAKTLKTADASMAAELRDPNKILCRALHPTDKAFLPTGEVVQFEKDLAWVTREQAEHLQDPNRFAFDVPTDTEPLPGQQGPPAPPPVEGD